jgi:hypothetical protein
MTAATTEGHWLTPQVTKFVDSENDYARALDVEAAAISEPSPEWHKTLRVLHLPVSNRGDTLALRQIENSFKI